MGFTNKYFSNVSNFEKIAEALRTSKRLPDKVDENILEQLGYTNPADALILRFFKELNFLTDDNSPTSLFEKFRDPDQSKEAFALGMLEAYGDLFEEEPTLHLQSEENITKYFESKLGDEKSNIIIGYMVKTFQVLIDYAGPESITSVLEKNALETSNNETKTDIAEATTLSEEAMNKGNGTATLVENNTQKQTSINGSDPTKTILSNEDMESVNNLTIETEYINKAYIKKAALLYKLDRYEEALPALGQVYERFANSNNAELYEEASDALIKKMDSAEKLEMNDELLPIYSEIIERFEDSEEKKFVEHADHAYMNVAEILLEKNQHDKALEVLDHAIKRLKNAQRNHDFLAKAMFKKAELHELSGYDQEALEAIEEFLDTFEQI